MTSTLRVALINPYTRAEGPGARFALWVQGCPIRCKGCFNPGMFDATGGFERSVPEIIQSFDESLALHPEIEGITLLGGEPFAQAKTLANLAEAIKARGKSVVTFSGYTHRHLSRGLIAGSRDLLRRTDVLVAGPFIESKVDRDRPWLGSTNQEFIYLTNRYSEEDFQASDSIEITVDASGSILINGWSTTSELTRLVTILRAQPTFPEPAWRTG